MCVYICTYVCWLVCVYANALGRISTVKSTDLKILKYHILTLLSCILILSLGI